MHQGAKAAGRMAPQNHESNSTECVDGEARGKMRAKHTVDDVSRRINSTSGRVERR